MDFGNMMDDGEVQLNLPREEDMERNLPAEDARDLPGETASGASVINQEERCRLEPHNGARPKWTRLGRPLPVIEEPSSPGAGAMGAKREFRARCYYRFGKMIRMLIQTVDIFPGPRRTCWWIRWPTCSGI